jgi:hypothetical protein
LSNVKIRPLEAIPIGIAVSVGIGFVQSRHVRAPIDRRFLAALAALLAFGYFVFPFVLAPAFNSPPNSFIRIFAYFWLLWMQVYILAGLWFDNYLLWIGILVTCAILLGVFLFSAVFWLWLAVFGAVPLILSGFYVRYFMS